jgi:beta-galactosidase
MDLKQKRRLFMTGLIILLTYSFESLLIIFFMLNRFSHSVYFRVFMISCLFFATISSLVAQSRKQLNFNQDWFFKLDSSKSYLHDHNLTTWRRLDLPHDWSIEMKFDKKSPANSGAGYLSGGIGWYKKELILSDADKGQRVFIQFEGVYEQSEVWINGHSLGKRPNGFIGFSYDLTDHLLWRGKKNIITVKVDNNKQPNVRFYSGSGIYRSVQLVMRNPISVGYHGTFVKPLHVDAKKAVVQLQVTVDHQERNVENIQMRSIVFSPQGRRILFKEQEIKLPEKKTAQVMQEFTLENPNLWDLHTPQQYKVVVEIVKDGKVLDRHETKFGLRSFVFEQDKGFMINGRPLKIRGVCMHSDLGSLGMAFNKSAALRQLKIMKEMGVNGIRTSHNPASEQFLDLCDSLGFIVMSETFDVWKIKKNTYDYHLYWDDWFRRDFEDHIKRDRNHPSLFIWCLGNEAQEQWHSKTDGIQIPKILASIVDSLDGTRPTTIANNEMSKDNPVLMSDAVDLVGYNYNHQKWSTFQKDHPGKKIIITESTSALQSRGQYDPISVDSMRKWPERWDIPFEGGNPDQNISAYDHVFTPWGSNHQTSLRLLEQYDFISGMFVWTGFDYLGEPTPYLWPARSSYFGIVDLAGFPKDVYYLYQSVWSDQTVLHILPHWNWQQTDHVDVVVYFNQADRVDLYLNNRKIGEQLKSADRYDAVFRNVPFEAGELKAISYRAGQEVKTATVVTAKAAHQVKLTLETDNLRINENELAFVHATIIDQEGNTVPMASNEVEFFITDKGAQVVATDNGSTTDHTSFQSTKRKTFNGKSLAIVKGNKKGTYQLIAKSNGLISGQVEINFK